MSAHTDTQIIMEDGHPAFAVIPWREFEAIRPTLEKHRKLRDGIPHAVVERMALDDVPPIRAWREHLGLDQTTVAERAGMKQPALARLESGKGGTPRRATLERIAAAMGLTFEQLDI